jgi:glycosyltransferase involved in cell wall biosynthesis
LPRLARKAGCALIYSASGYPEIFTKLPTVTHQQNLWSFAPPQRWWPLKSHVKSFLRRQVAKMALIRSSANVFISDYLRDIANLNIPKAAAKNFIVSNAISPTNLNPRNTLTEEWADRDYCLAVGSSAVHKNYLTLIRTFRLVADECPKLHLIIVGNFTNKHGRKTKQLCTKLKLDDKITFTGTLDFEKVINLYHQAKFSVNLSLLEGFGLPVLESMGTGCPVICSDIPAFHEIGDEAVLYCNPTNPQDIGEKMISLYRNETKCKELSKMGLEHSKRFSWHQSAAQMLDVFKFALGEQAYETNSTKP